MPQLPPHPHTRHLGLLLKMLREQAGLSQGAVAGLLDVRLDTLQNWEQGRRDISAGRLLDWLRLLGVERSRWGDLLGSVQDAVGEVQPPRRGRPRKQSPGGAPTKAKEP